MIGSLCLEQFANIIETFLFVKSEEVLVLGLGVEWLAFPYKSCSLQHGEFHLFVQYFQGKSWLNESYKYLSDHARITS